MKGLLECYHSNRTFEAIEDLVSGIGILKITTEKIKNEDRYKVTLCREADADGEENSEITDNFVAYNLNEPTDMKGFKNLCGVGRNKEEALILFCVYFDCLVSLRYCITINDKHRGSSGDIEVYKTYVYSIVADEAAGVYRKVLIKRTTGNGHDLGISDNIYWTVSELVRDNLVYTYHIDTSKLCTEIFPDRRIDRSHEHEYESLLEIVIREPYAIYFTDVDKVRLSEQEYSLIQKVTKYMQFNYSAEYLKNCDNILEELMDKVSGESYEK